VDSDRALFFFNVLLGIAFITILGHQRDMLLLLSAQVNPFLPSGDTLVTLKIMTVLLIVILGKLPW